MKDSVKNAAENTYDEAKDMLNKLSKYALNLYYTVTNDDKNK